MPDVSLRKPIRGAPRAKLEKLEVCMDSALVWRDPEIMSGALRFTGTRVPVKNLHDYLAGCSSLENFLEDFPTVSRERAVAVLESAHESLAAEGFVRCSQGLIRRYGPCRAPHLLVSRTRTFFGSIVRLIFAGYASKQ